MALGVGGSHLTLIRGARAAASNGDSEALALVTIELCNSGSVALTGIEMEPVVELVKASLRSELPDGLRRMLWAASARAFVYSAMSPFGQELYRKAFDVYESCNQETQELILRNSEAGLSDPDDLVLAKRATVMIAAAADRNPELRWLARWFQFRDALISADGDRLALAMKDIRESATQSERRYAFVVLGQTFDLEMQQAWAESTLAMIHDDLDRAEEEANRALEIELKQLEVRGDGFGTGWVTSSYGLLLIAIRHRQGRLAELVDLVDTEAPLIPAWRIAIVITNFAAGNIERARQELDIVCANGFELLVRDPTWTAAMWLLAEPVIELMDRLVIEALYTALLPFADRMSYSGLCTFGPVRDSLALLADALGDNAGANEHRRLSAVMTTQLRERSAWANGE
ncbi:MAG: hypothetical protein ACI81L_000412 [Verrucomicrobiales bacterium]|jgi:hypothetical protein